MTLPSDSVSIVFTSPITKMADGATGQRYWIRPNMIAADVKPDDAAAFITSGDARNVTADDQAVKVGYEARK